MAIIKCKDCEGQISSTAVSCLHCGSIIRKKFRITLSITINIIFLIVAIITTCVAVKSNKRAERLFGSQIRPLIQDRPKDISFRKEDASAETTLFVVNDSGFNASNITFDLKYGDRDWIVEWMKAKINDLEKKKKTDRTKSDNEDLKYYKENVKPIKILEAGKSLRRTARGKLTEDIISTGIDVLVQTTWENENGYTFDRIRKYKLVPTIVNKGHSFKFIPSGIVSYEE